MEGLMFNSLTVEEAKHDLDYVYAVLSGHRPYNSCFFKSSDIALTLDPVMVNEDYGYKYRSKCAELRHTETHIKECEAIIDKQDAKIEKLEELIEELKTELKISPDTYGTKELLKARRVNGV